MKVGVLFRRAWLAYLMLALGLGLSVFAYGYMRGSVESQARDRFNGGVQLLRNSLVQQTDRYIDTLLLTRGFVAGSEDVTRSEWITYTRSIDLQTHYPGMLGIGLARRVNAEDLPAHIEAVRHEITAHGGRVEYNVTPAAPPRKVYFPTVYIEPFDTPVRRNQRALGYDMFAEPTRRMTMEIAMLTGEPTVTPRLTLGQEGDAEGLPGFLVYVPIYRRGAPQDTPEQRQESIVGFIYGSYHTASMFHGMLQDLAQPARAAFQIYDGTPGSDTLLFDSRPHANPRRPDPLPADGLRRQETLAVGGGPGNGRKWTLVFFPAESLLSPSEERLPMLVLFGGFLTSWLLFGLLWIEIRARLTTEAASQEVQRTQNALRTSEQRYRLKIEQSPLAIQTFSPDGATTNVNRAWEELWGLKLADLAHYNVLEDPELARRGVADLIRRGFAGEAVTLGPIYYEPRVAGTQHGRPRWVRSVMYPIKDDRGNIREVVLMHEDFTQRKEIELELTHAKEEAERANTAKDRFLAILSHELRNPLAPVLTMADLLGNDGVSAEESREALEVIRRNIELESRLIDDLLDMTRIARGKLSLEVQRADAHTALAHALEICHAEIRAKRLELDVQLEAEFHDVMGDPARLRQIFWNLIKNAVKFTPESGRIVIRSWNEPVGPAREQARLAVEVSDSGIGIEPSVLARIFEAFEQADRSITQRFGGLGLGLAISRALVDAHNGQITASSGGLHRGATFTVRLPTVAPVDAATAGTGPASGNGAGAPSGSSLRVLLVEDHADARRALTLLLRRSGYDVRAAASASEALKIAAEWECDLLLSDLGLPDISGLELVRRIRAERPIPAIALTGLGMEEDVRAALAAGFSAHLTKPVQFEKLQQLIAKLAQPI